MRFLMLGKYSLGSLKGMSSGRTKRAVALIKKNGGKVVSMYALLGRYDLVLIVEFPGVAEAMRASVALVKMTQISFTTSPALAIEVFDRMMR